MPFPESIRQFVKTYVIHYLSDQKQFEFFTSNKSDGIWKVIEKNNALSFFMRERIDQKEIFRVVLSGMQPKKCFSYHPGHQTDNEHHHWHINEDTEIQFQHTHILKDDDKQITISELKCLMENLRDFDKQNVVHTKGDVGLIHEKDSDQLIEEYKKYYKNPITYSQQEREKKIEELTNKMCLIIEKTFYKTLKIFITSFVDTFLNFYVKRYMQSKQINDLTITALIMITRSSLIAAMTPSYMEGLVRASLNNCSNEVTQTILRKLSIDEETAISWATVIASALTFIRDPFSILEMATNTGMAYGGKMTAFNLIKTLPKIVLPKVKQEDQPLNEREKQDHFDQRKIGKNAGLSPRDR